MPPFEGFTHTLYVERKLLEIAPKVFFINLILATWLRDAGGSLDPIKALGATCLLWAAIRPRVCWLTRLKPNEARVEQILGAPFGVSSLRPSQAKSACSRSERSQIKGGDWQLLDPQDDPERYAVLGWLPVTSVRPLVRTKHKVQAQEDQLLGADGAQSASTYEQLDISEAEVPG